MITGDTGLEASGSEEEKGLSDGFPWAALLFPVTSCHPCERISVSTSLVSHLVQCFALNESDGVGFEMCSSGEGKTILKCVTGLSLRTNFIFFL